MRKPVIGMAYSDCATRDHEMRVRTYCTHKYYQALQKAGAQVILLPPVSDDTDFENALLMVDGVLLPGGEDIDPIWQGEAPVPGLGLVNPWRDEYELRLAKTCYDCSIPLLGICRGIQVMAVALGGKLHQDIKTLPEVLKHEQQAPRWYPSHEVEVESPSLLSSWLFSTPREASRIPRRTTRKEAYEQSTRKIRVNSFHHQTVKVVPEGCRVTAYAPDRQIEAIEAVDTQQVYVGVQWHPEELFDSDALSRALFGGFVREVEAISLETQPEGLSSFGEKPAEPRRRSPRKQP